MDENLMKVFGFLSLTSSSGGGRGRDDRNNRFDSNLVESLFFSGLNFNLAQEMSFQRLSRVPMKMKSSAELVPSLHI